MKSNTIIKFTLPMYLAVSAVLFSGCMASRVTNAEDERYFTPLDTLPKFVARKNKESERYEQELRLKQRVIDSLKQNNQLLQDEVVRLQRRPEPKPQPPAPPAQIVLEKGRSIILEGVTFKQGSAALKKESDNILRKAFYALVANPVAEVEIAGYTDNQGDPAKNDQLSLKRAQTVRDWLLKKGIDPARLTIKGMGERSPVASNDTPEGRGKNRRIEFHVR